MFNKSSMHKYIIKWKHEENGNTLAIPPFSLKTIFMPSTHQCKENEAIPGEFSNKDEYKNLNGAGLEPKFGECATCAGNSSIILTINLSF